MYRLCWFGAGFDCHEPIHFQEDAGTLTLIGPRPLEQNRSCVSGQVCQFGSLLGLHLGNGDRIMVLDTCGLHTMPPRWATDKLSGKSRSDPSTTDGTDFHWGGYEDCDQTKNFDCQGVRPTTQGGDYQLG